LSVDKLWPSGNMRSVDQVAECNEPREAEMPNDDCLADEDDERAVDDEATETDERAVVGRELAPLVVRRIPPLPGRCVNCSVVDMTELPPPFALPPLPPPPRVSPFPLFC
jgi:hypothetical protein